MVLETLLGGVLGSVSRLVPEFLKWWDRGNERKHELAMQDKALEFEKLRGAGRMAEIGAQAQASYDVAALEALKASIEAQGKPSGIGWVDALASLVRPTITYIYLALYCAVKMAAYIAAVRGGIDPIEALRAVWTDADLAIWSGIINFYFLDRVIRRTSAR